jgi:hypothetical protein
MKEREEGIARAYKRTFEWIFNESSHGFVEWLERGADIY